MWGGRMVFNDGIYVGWEDDYLRSTLGRISLLNHQNSTLERKSRVLLSLLNPA